MASLFGSCSLNLCTKLSIEAYLVALGPAAAGAVDMQLVLGYVLYFLSPLVASFHLRDATHGPATLFFGFQHVGAMALAIIVLTIGSALAKRQATDLAKFRTMVL